MKAGWQAWWRDQSGGTAVFTAIMLIVIFGAIGLAMDMGHYYTVNQQLKNAADAGALAGVRAIYPVDLKSVALPFAPDCTNALIVGRATAQENKNDTYNVVVADIQAGHYDLKHRTFNSVCSSDPANHTNAVRVTTRRENCPLYFMQLLGFRPYTLQATSIALMDWAGNKKPGGGLGLALGKDYAKTGYIEIPVNDESSDKGGWYASPPLTPTDSLLMDYLEGKAQIPLSYPGDMVNLNNGVFNNVVRELGENFVGTEFIIPVVETVKFNQEAKVVGFTVLEIVKIGKHTADGGKHYIAGIARPLAMAPAKSTDPGGSDFGLLSAARLVY